MLSVYYSKLTLYISEVSQLYWTYTIIRQARLYIVKFFPLCSTFKILTYTIIPHCIQTGSRFFSMSFFYLNL